MAKKDQNQKMEEITGQLKQGGEDIYKGHSLSVSDIVVLQKEHEMKAYYIDSQKLPDFILKRKELLELPAKNAQHSKAHLSSLAYAKETVTDQTRGLAVEGHFGTWHTAEVCEIAGEQFYRMEHDEYGSTVAGIIVDADGKLVAGDMEYGFDESAIQAITEYLHEKGPKSFIKQYYVVNDTYGVSIELEYQYFDTLDEAIGAYHQIPNHLEKHLGMKSTEPVPSRMTLLKCENGIDKLEDIERSSLTGKWVKPEVTEAQRKAEFYLDNRNTAIAYYLGAVERYLFIQTGGTEGYDYTFYDANFDEIDGGIYDDIAISLEEAVKNILEGEGLAGTRYEVIDCQEFQDSVERAKIMSMKTYQALGNMPDKEKEQIQSNKLTPTSKMERKEKALNGWSRHDIEKTVLCYAQAQLEEMGLEDEVKLNAARVYGSRTEEGLYREDSDIDIVLSYSGNIREDDFFNMLYKKGMSIAGLPVDINPIDENKTGPLAAFMEKSKKYLIQKSAQLLAEKLD